MLLVSAIPKKQIKDVENEETHVHGAHCNHGHEVIETIKRECRNDSYPCGSEKKFKKCCGK